MPVAMKTVTSRLTIRSENRAILVASIARGRRWLDELIADPTANTESIAGREGCSVRKVNMTISLAFLAPDPVKAAIEATLVIEKLTSNFRLSVWQAISGSPMALSHLRNVLDVACATDTSAKRERWCAFR